MTCSNWLYALCVLTCHPFVFTFRLIGTGSCFRLLFCFASKHESHSTTSSRFAHEFIALMIQYTFEFEVFKSWTPLVPRDSLGEDSIDCPPNSLPGYASSIPTPSPASIANIMSAFTLPPTYMSTVNLIAYLCATPRQAFDLDCITSLLSSTSSTDSLFFSIIFDTECFFAMTPELSLDGSILETISISALSFHMCLMWTCPNWQWSTSSNFLDGLKFKFSWLKMLETCSQR